MSLSCLGLTSSETLCLVATTLQSSADKFGEVEQFRYCLCMQKEAASPKTVVASSASPKLTGNSSHNDDDDNNITHESKKYYLDN
jgi:hypothetical protein